MFLQHIAEMKSLLAEPTYYPPEPVERDGLVIEECEYGTSKVTEEVKAFAREMLATLEQWQKEYE